MDTVDEKTRSRIMASVGQRDTVPEIKLRRILHSLGLRYRLHDRNLPGSPDLVFPRYRAAFFVHGCFWHVHEGCRFNTMPSTRKEFWNGKFQANKARDYRNNKAFAAKGWRVLIVWECAIKGANDDGLTELGFNVAHWLESDKRYGEIDGPLIMPK